MQRVDLAIIGAGPAGLSTALHLLQLDPSWARRMVILEKARHPRPKLCAGGITRSGLRLLQALGLPPSFPFLPVHLVRLRYQQRTVDIHARPMFVVTRRDEFDAWLADQARQRGVRLLEDTPVTFLERTPEGILLRTASGDFLAQAVVGADGATGVVRRWLQARERPPHVARALELVEPATAEEPEFCHSMAVFDFSPARQRLQGYAWDFPSLIAGRPHLNRGLYDARVAGYRPKADLKAGWPRWLPPRGAAPKRPAGHPIRWFAPTNRLRAPRVLLVGDAAGVDPLFGEGIAVALYYGKAAAHYLQRALSRGDLQFRRYRLWILRSQVGRYLILRWLGATLVYHLAHYSWFMHALWTVAAPAARMLQPRRPMPPYAHKPPPTPSAPTGQEPASPKADEG